MAIHSVQSYSMFHKDRQTFIAIYTDEIFSELKFIPFIALCLLNKLARFVWKILIE